MVVELLSLAAVLAGGSLLVRAAAWSGGAENPAGSSAGQNGGAGAEHTDLASGLGGWALPAFGLVAGVCLQVTVGLVQVVTPLPTWPALTLTLTFGLPALWWLVRWWRGHQVALPLRYAALTLAGLAAAVAVLRVANLVKWHTDSFRYLMTGSLLADGSYYAAVPTESVTKRLIGVPLLHAPAHLHGEHYLRAVTPLLAIATLAILGWFCWHGLRHRLDRRWLLGLVVLGVVLLASGNRFVFSAFYINGHLLIGVLLLVVAGAGWLRLLPDRAAPGGALLALQLLAVPAIVVTRPEGSLLAGLALLPTLLCDRVPLRHRSALLVLLGATTVAWQSLVVWVHIERGVPVPVSVTGPLAAGVLVAVAGLGLLRWQRPPAHPLRLLWLAEAGLWLALLALAAYRPQILADSVRATVQNLLFGAGRWGLSLVVLGLLMVVALGFARLPRQAYLRFPITSFIPMALLLAYLRDAAYRVGYGDSLSRMLMHIVPLVVLYLVLAAGHRIASPVPTIRTVSQ